MTHQDRTTRIHTVARYLGSKKRFSNKELLVAILALEDIRENSSGTSLRVAQNVIQDERETLLKRTLARFGKTCMSVASLSACILAPTACTMYKTADGSDISTVDWDHEGSDLTGGIVRPRGSDEDWRPGQGR